jgi:hypothetical protein
LPDIHHCGVGTRLACLPIIAVLLVAMLAVHPQWSIAEGQFGWLLLIIFTTLALTGRVSGGCRAKGVQAWRKSMMFTRRRQTPSAASAFASWQPLRQPVFRMLWIATVVSNIGSWMNDVGVNWTMLTLSADPLIAGWCRRRAACRCFFALPSGVMADIVDRRKYLLFSQLWVFIAAAG